jgi:cysteinyl-tRNA synthetase
MGKGFEPAAIRLELIKAHYRTNANFTEQGLRDSARMVERWRRFGASASEEEGTRNDEVAERFAGAMHDDLNVAGAIGVMNAWMNATQTPTRADAGLLRTFDDALGVLGLCAGDEADDPDAARIGALIADRARAREAKDWAASDRIRDELAAMGVSVKDGPSGATWSREARL